MEYRILTLWQPWATLLVHGIKQIETRPSPTTFTAEKGTYLIHAAKKLDKENMHYWEVDPFLSLLQKLGYVWNHNGQMKCELPLGQIIGSVEIEYCMEVKENNLFADAKNRPVEHFNSQLSKNTETKTRIPLKEFYLGDIHPGRWLWICKNPKILKEPIPYRGQQGYYGKYKGDINKLNFL